MSRRGLLCGYCYCIWRLHLSIWFGLSKTRLAVCSAVSMAAPAGPAEDWEQAAQQLEDLQLETTHPAADAGAVPADG